MGVFYTIVMLAQTLGFGVDKQGTESFVGLLLAVRPLSRGYVGPVMADGINFGVMVSAFASALGTVAAEGEQHTRARRGGFLWRRLGETSDRTGAPVNALAVVMVIAIVAFVAQHIVRYAPLVLSPSRSSMPDLRGFPRWHRSRWPSRSSWHSLLRSYALLR